MTAPRVEMDELLKDNQVLSHGRSQHTPLKERKASYDLHWQLVCVCVGGVSGQIQDVRDSSLVTPRHCFSQTALERKTFTNSPREETVYKLKLS